MNELRREPLLGRWVLVTKESLPPDAYGPFVTPSQEVCPVCNHSEDEEILSRQTDTGTIKVLHQHNAYFLSAESLNRRGLSMYDLMDSVGRTELVVEISEHGKPLETASVDHLKTLLDIYHERMTVLEEDPMIRQVLVYKNCGGGSGDTCGHAHSFISAMPVIPKTIKEELDGAKSYYEYKERCIFCDIMKEELRIGERVVMETDACVVITPFAGRFPFEFWLLPKRHGCSYRDTNEEERQAIAYTLLRVLRRFAKLLKGAPYNMIFHTSPSRIPRHSQWHTLGEDFHWHIEVMPRLTGITGFELGAGMHILTTSPEDAAKYLKEVQDD